MCSHLTTLRPAHFHPHTHGSSPALLLSPLGPVSLLSVFMDLPVLDVSLHKIIQYAASLNMRFSGFIRVVSRVTPSFPLFATRRHQFRGGAGVFNFYFWAAQLVRSQFPDWDQTLAPVMKVQSPTARPPGSLLGIPGF